MLSRYTKRLCCGSSWTRTNELERGKIYSLLPLPLGDAPKLGKGKMVEWTIPFTIGITMMISTPNTYPPIIRVIRSIPSPINLFARVRDHDSLIQVLETCVLPITPYPHFYSSSLLLNVSNVGFSRILNPSSLLSYI